MLKLLIVLYIKWFFDELSVSFNENKNNIFL